MWKKNSVKTHSTIVPQISISIVQSWYPDLKGRRRSKERENDQEDGEERVKRKIFLDNRPSQHYN